MDLIPIEGSLGKYTASFLEGESTALQAAYQEVYVIEVAADTLEVEAIDLVAEEILGPGKTKTLEVDNLAIDGIMQTLEKFATSTSKKVKHMAKHTATHDFKNSVFGERLHVGREAGRLSQSFVEQLFEKSFAAEMANPSEDESHTDLMISTEITAAPQEERPAPPIS